VDQQRSRRFAATVVALSALVSSACYSTEMRNRQVLLSNGQSPSPSVETIIPTTGPDAGKSAAASRPGSGGASPGAQGATDVGVMATTIKLGFVGDFSGQARAIYGVSLDTINAFIADLNSRGGINGRRIQLTYYSASYQSPDQVLAATRRLVEQDKVFAMIGLTGIDNAATSAVPYMSDKGVPCAGCRAKGVRNLAMYRTAFDGQITPPDLGTVIGGFAAKRLGKKRMAIGYCPSAYSEWVKEAIGPAFRKFGGTVVDERDIGACDQTLMDSTVAAWYGIYPRPDVIAVVDPLGSAEGTAAARRMGWDVQFIGAGGWFQVVLDIGGSQTEGMIGTADGYGPPGYDTPQMTHLRQVLKSYYPQRNVDVTVLNSWDWMSIFEEGARRAGPNLTRAGLISALNGLRDWNNGIGAPLTFSPQRHMGRSATGLFRIHDEAFQRATPEDFMSAGDF